MHKLLKSKRLWAVVVLVIVAAGIGLYSYMNAEKYIPGIINNDCIASTSSVDGNPDAPPSCQ